jgi:hypothetical protein
MSWPSPSGDAQACRAEQDAHALPRRVLTLAVAPSTLTTTPSSVAKTFSSKNRAIPEYETGLRTTKYKHVFRNDAEQTEAGMFR